MNRLWYQRLMLAITCLASLCSCTFHEHADGITVKGCVVASEPVSYTLTPYGGTVPERIFQGDFDSLDSNNCFESTVMWKSGGKTTFFGIPIYQSSASGPEQFGLLTLGANGVTKGFTFQISDKCIDKTCNIDTIKY